MNLNPFHVTGPTCISFSGGRSSALLLYRVLEAHAGQLPPETFVLFANTGMEFPQTLDFVQTCSERWKVPIHWLEYDGAGADARASRAPDPSRFEGFSADRSYRVVTHATAARRGEPFAQLIAQDRYLPNAVQRTCTQHLKVEAMHAFLRSVGVPAWTSFLGLRADEPHRVAKMRANEEPHETKRAPLHTAGITQGDVEAFWRAQPFDLGLRWWESNCTLCFLKGQTIRHRILVDHPETAAFWIAQEQRVGARFVKSGPSYAQLAARASRQLRLPLLEDPPEHDAIAHCTCTD